MKCDDRAIVRVETKRDVLLAAVFWLSYERESVLSVVCVELPRVRMLVWRSSQHEREPGAWFARSCVRRRSRDFDFETEKQN